MVMPENVKEATASRVSSALIQRVLRRRHQDQRVHTQVAALAPTGLDDRENRMAILPAEDKRGIAKASSAPIPGDLESGTLHQSVLLNAMVTHQTTDQNSAIGHDPTGANLTMPDLVRTGKDPHLVHVITALSLTIAVQTKNLTVGE